MMVRLLGKSSLLRLITLVPLALSGLAWSDAGIQWSPISTNQAHSVVVYADLNQISREASIVRIRLLFDNLGADADGRRSYVTLREYHCDRGLTRTLEERFHAGQMGTGGQVSAQASPDCEIRADTDPESTACAAPWSAVRPRTIGYDVFTAVCQLQTT